MAANTVCPASGLDTGIARDADAELGGLAPDELDTLIRNEWRRRLGPAAYARPQSRALIRALIVYSLAPESPVRRQAADWLLLREMAVWGAFGLTRDGILRELQMLLEAISAVLTQRSSLGGEVDDLVERIAQKVRQCIGTPERLSRSRIRP